jgi:hypothetical protein
LIAADKARWKQIEADARAGKFVDRNAIGLDRRALNEDTNAFFNDRAATTYENFEGPGTTGSRP